MMFFFISMAYLYFFVEVCYNKIYDESTRKLPRADLDACQN